MNLNRVIINHRSVDAGNLQEFTRSWTGDPDLPAFLESWFDPHEGFLAHTSGSTGKPSVITLQKKYAVASARATIGFLGLESGNTALLSMPARFIAGRMMIIRALVGRFDLITVPPSSTPEIPDHILDLAAFTPHQFQNILTQSKNKNHRKIKNVLLGGGPVADELIQSLPDFPGNIYETFGMTETYSHIALRMRYPVAEPYFKAVPHVTFTTEDSRLIIHAPHLGLPELRTHDVVHLEGPHHFKWLGRSDFVINSGGLKLFPEVIEKKLAGVIQSPYFITGQPDREFGEKVVLVIQKGDETSVAGIQTLIDGILSKYEKPKIIIWIDKMIYTPTGKINRPETRKHYHI